MSSQKNFIAVDDTGHRGARKTQSRWCGDHGLDHTWVFLDGGDIFLLSLFNVADLAMEFASAKTAVRENLLGDAGAEFFGTESPRAGETSVSKLTLSRNRVRGGFFVVVVVRDVD